MAHMISKLLIANRGEIACRVIETARDLGIKTVAVYSEADASARHVALADEAVLIGPASVSESYLRADAILAAAKSTGAHAIHPGYGFLSENPEFVDAVDAAGLIFVGPSAASIRAMGLKDKAKTLMEAAGVPVVPGYHGEDQDPQLLATQADKIGYPVLIKARAGGGGKGMRLVEKADDFADALTSAQREGLASFGDAAVLIEKYILSPRHIEVQVFGDRHGNVVHMFERDCSLQRRHQKVIEEAPAPGMTDDVRNAMGAAAVAAAQAVDYVGAGTVEFIVDGSGALRTDGFWFMEMNTRLQVEHPVTEAVTGLDLVALQLSVAEGHALPFAQEDIQLKGHAFEARLYAEDPSNDFLPMTGRLTHLQFPEKGARVDSGVTEGSEITPFYDPMIAKIITQGDDRASALRALQVALGNTRIAGCKTNRAFLQRLASDTGFASGDVDTGLIARRGDALTSVPEPDQRDYALAALLMSKPSTTKEALSDFRLFGPATRTVRFAGAEDVEATIRTYGSGRCEVETSVGLHEFERVGFVRDALEVTENGRISRVSALMHEDRLTLDADKGPMEFERRAVGGTDAGDAGDNVVAPMPGRIIAVHAKTGDEVVKGDALLVLEAMKMEHSLTAPRDGTIAELMAELDDQVAQGAVLVKFTS